MAKFGYFKKNNIMGDIFNESWESTYDSLLKLPHQEVLDTEFETGRYYELPWMIEYFRKKGENDKVDFLIALEEKIESEEGRKYTIGDKFILDNDIVKCVIEITDFDENGAAYIEYSDIEYKTAKKEIPQDFNVHQLKRIR